MEKKNVLVCVTGQLSCERLIVAGARIAETSGGMVLRAACGASGKSRARLCKTKPRRWNIC